MILAFILGLHSLYYRMSLNSLWRPMARHQKAARSAACLAIPPTVETSVRRTLVSGSFLFTAPLFLDLGVASNTGQECAPSRRSVRLGDQFEQDDTHADETVCAVERATLFFRICRIECSHAVASASQRRSPPCATARGWPQRVGVSAGLPAALLNHFFEGPDRLVSTARIVGAEAFGSGTRYTKPYAL